MKIEVLGTGCTKCKAMEENTKQAIARIGGFHSFAKIEDPVEIVQAGILSTPGLRVDGVIKHSGKLLSVEEIVEILKAQ